MDVIISANEAVLQMIKEIPVNTDGSIDEDVFKLLLMNITNKEKGTNNSNEI